MASTPGKRLAAGCFHRLPGVMVCGIWPWKCGGCNRRRTALPLPAWFIMFMIAQNVEKCNSIPGVCPEGRRRTAGAAEENRITAGTGNIRQMPFGALHVGRSAGTEDAARPGPPSELPWSRRRKLPRRPESRRSNSGALFSSARGRPSASVRRLFEMLFHNRRCLKSRSFG